MYIVGNILLYCIYISLFWWKPYPSCCVFWPANGCSALHLLVKIIFFSVKTSFTIFFQHKQKKRSQKNDLDQRTACGAPVCWLKYTTPSAEEWHGCHPKNNCRSFWDRFQANAFLLTLLGVSLVVSIGTKVYVTFVTLGKL